MGVLGDEEVAAEALDPIPGRAEEAHLLFVLLVGGLALLGGEVAGVFGRPRLVEDGGVIAAVERDVGLDEEMVGEEAAAVAEEDLEDVVGLGALAPAGGARLEEGGQGEAGGQQQEQNQEGTELVHRFKALRRNTSQAAKRSRAE